VHSNSSTIVNAFQELPLTESSFKIYQTESNPAKEGLIQGESLRRIGFDVTIIEDNPTPALLNQIDFLVTGADLILETEFINKMGTRRIAEHINERQKPYIVVADPRKFSIDRPTNIPNIFEFIPRNRITILISG
jgi:translation initiation factor eIF-2B subunit alpha